MTVEMMLLHAASIILSYLTLHGLAQTSTVTSVVSVYSTTTVQGPPAPPGPPKPDDYTNACNNFVGACVVYGSGTDGAAPYTTTVYVSGNTPSPTTVVTFSTTTIPATRTVTGSSAGACGDFTGACVVYGTGNGAASTTVYASGTPGSGSNDGDGVIGQNSGGDGQIGGSDSHGQLGGASGLQIWTTASAVGLVALGFAFMIGL